MQRNDIYSLIYLALHLLQESYCHFSLCQEKKKQLIYYLEVFTMCSSYRLQFYWWHTSDVLYSSLFLTPQSMVCGNTGVLNNFFKAFSASYNTACRRLLSNLECVYLSDHILFDLFLTTRNSLQILSNKVLNNRITSMLLAEDSGQSI